MNTTKSTQFYFGRLPRELRDKIYDMLVEYFKVTSFSFERPDLYLTYETGNHANSTDHWQPFLIPPFETALYTGGFVNLYNEMIEARIKVSVFVSRPIMSPLGLGYASLHTDVPAFIARGIRVLEFGIMLFDDVEPSRALGDSLKSLAKLQSGDNALPFLTHIKLRWQGQDIGTEQQDISDEQQQHILAGVLLVVPLINKLEMEIDGLFGDTFRKLAYKIEALVEWNLYQRCLYYRKGGFLDILTLQVVVDEVIRDGKTKDSA